MSTNHIDKVINRALFTEITRISKRCASKGGDESDIQLINDLLDTVVQRNQPEFDWEFNAQLFKKFFIVGFSLMKGKIPNPFIEITEVTDEEEQFLSFLDSYFRNVLKIIRQQKFEEIVPLAIQAFATCSSHPGFASLLNEAKASEGSDIQEFFGTFSVQTVPEVHPDNLD
jgi:hypothetical protein